MSIEAMAVCMQHAPFAGRDKLVLLGIANHDGDGGAFPAIGTLARYANCSVASVKRSLAVLVDAGAIVKHVQKGGMNVPEYAKTNLYEVMVECPANCDKSRRHKPIDPKLPAASMLWSNPGSTLNPGAVLNPGGGSVVEPRGGSVVDLQTTLKPSNELQTPSPSRSTSPAKCWACGKLHTAKGSYCTTCSSAGLNTPIINCHGCNLTKRRSYPGQQSFDCGGH